MEDYHAKFRVESESGNFILRLGKDKKRLSRNKEKTKGVSKNHTHSKVNPNVEESYDPETVQKMWKLV